MTETRASEVTIHLHTIHDLFTPSKDPFLPEAIFLPGIELIKNELNSSLLMAKTRTSIVILLPREHVAPDLAGKTTRAIQNYCHFKIRQNQQALFTQFRQALIALLLGILFLVSGLFLSHFLEHLTSFPTLLSTIFSDGFAIAFWVILWRPIDFFLFDLWPYIREDHIYKHMMKMRVVIAEEP